MGNAANLTDKDILIKNESDMLDCIASYGYEFNTNNFILTKEQFTDEFFDLKTKVLGNCLQKCKNYNVRLAIVGNFEAISSKSLRDFIYESNKGNDFYFVSTTNEALNKFT